eukprot:14445731-Alexandrium_andersonii.AAC.1
MPHSQEPPKLPPLVNRNGPLELMRPCREAMSGRTAARNNPVSQRHRTRPPGPAQFKASRNFA